MSDKDRISKYITPLLPIPTALGQSGKLEEKIKCVLFDIYGTLFISASGDISIAKKQSPKMRELEQLLADFEIRKTPQTLLRDFFRAIENTHNELSEKGTDYPEVDIIRIWTSVLNLNHSDTLKAFAAEFEMIVNPVYPMPHLKEMLFVYKKQNIMMGIISNAQFYTPYLFNWFLDADIESLGFHPDLVFFSYKFGYAKPSDFLFQMAADKLKGMGYLPGSVLYVGNDMLNDIYPAMKMGFKTALFAGDKRSLRLRKDNEVCKNLAADLVITDLNQLSDYVN
ncbi:HAD family hydrolase [Desulfonema magnum]|uniref:HAD hydrolase family protein n=1 Tax=Desulfonema magnum TaxID=45655 RepID=A0A975GQ71_9BACT|nr:HAD family hydrolase [Desulfonema magnum]QTA89577.1 HAD hydrolase family protein [Desulfonema magnum]